MAKEFTTDITGAVVDSFAGTADLMRELLGALARHLHAFVRETRPTTGEWESAIGFLTETGRMCTDTRQEFILLSDVLGVSMLVETLNGHGEPGATESTVLGSFHLAFGQGARSFRAGVNARSRGAGRGGAGKPNRRQGGSAPRARRW